MGLRDRLRAFAEECGKEVGSWVKAIFLTGPALHWEEAPRGAEVDLLLVVDDLNMEALGRLRGVVQRWRRRLRLNPVVLSPAEMRRSLDVFPLEYARLQSQRWLIWGEDLLEGLEIPQEALRLQIEEELKTLLFHVRRAYLMAQGPKELGEVVRSALRHLERLLWGLLFLKGERRPLEGEALLEGVAAAYGLEEDNWLKIWESAQARPPRGSEEALFVSLLRQVERLSDCVDRMGSS